MLSEHDQVGAVVTGGVDDRRRRRSGGPHVLRVQPGRLDHRAGAGEKALDVGRRAERRRIRRAVVERAEVLQAGRVERELLDGDDDQLRASVARLGDRTVERAPRGRAVVVADQHSLHQWCSLRRGHLAETLHCAATLRAARSARRVAGV